ncbi:TetR/AcrR family transcriptional regulator [Amycolatopsis sp. MEPSY49]|uniref:TetR/AcrR family transcriptional regulator n=1 Tax=Amycolatopsis sp. MEPSY49 TaxID=3151600 RepID=UPI003EF85911
MRYPKDHKETARAEILAAAARPLKEKGFGGVGVDGLAAAADVTSGAIYSHFGSKEAFLEQVVNEQLGAEFAVVDDLDPDERRRRLAEFLHFYLSDEHCAAVADGCLMPALTADVSRASDAVREAYERRMAALIERLTPAMPGSPAEQAESAWALVASVVGAVTIARALPPGERSRAIRAATLRCVTAVLDGDARAAG